jgi:hypothetical protein
MISVNGANSPRIFTDAKDFHGFDSSRSVASVKIRGELTPLVEEL